MLRRPPTVLSITAEDVAAYEDRQDREAHAAAQRQLRSKRAGDPTTGAGAGAMDLSSDDEPSTQQQQPDLSPPTRFPYQQVPPRRLPQPQQSTPNIHSSDPEDDYEDVPSDEEEEEEEDESMVDMDLDGAADPRTLHALHPLPPQPQQPQPPPPPPPTRTMNPREAYAAHATPPQPAPFETPAAPARAASTGTNVAQAQRDARDRVRAARRAAGQARALSGTQQQLQQAQGSGFTPEPSTSSRTTTTMMTRSREERIGGVPARGGGAGAGGRPRG